MAIMKDFYLPAGTNLSYFFEDSGFDYVSKKEDYLANNVYIKIESIKSDVSEAIMVVDFKKDKDSQVILTKEYVFAVSLSNDSSNIFEQGYKYLCSLEEFKGALDV